MRAFLALPLPAQICRELARAAEELGSSLDLRAQKPGTIHLTLRFLGEIEDPEPVAAAVGEVAAGHEPFALELGGLGVFPHPRSARVLWAGVTAGQEAAAALARDLETALVPLGFPREKRPWKAHVTLGRFRRPTRLSSRPDSERSFGSLRAERVVLYRSTLTPEGAVHEELRDLSLGRAT